MHTLFNREHNRIASALAKKIHYGMMKHCIKKQDEL